MIPINPQWEEEFLPKSNCYPFGEGYYNSAKKTVYIRPPWFPFFFLLPLIKKHEYGHSWGIKMCDKPWCIMFEAMVWRRTWKDIWWEKALMFFCCPFNLFRFCREHKELLNEKLL